MRRPARLAMAVMLLLSLLCVGVAHRAVGGVLGPVLRLHRGTFDARASAPPASSSIAVADSGVYAVVQLRGPISSADRAALMRTGVQLLEYLPDYAYLVRGSQAQVDAAARLPQVYARVPFTIEDKLHPALQAALRRGDADVGLLHVVGWSNDPDALTRDLQAVGVMGSASISARTLVQVARLPAVRWIEPMILPRLLNDRARQIMHVDGSAWQSRGLFGSGQIVAVTDSGLDTGVTGTVNLDFAGRIVATHVVSPGGDWADQHGHGTHVAGSIAGAGVLSGAIPAQHRYIGSFAGIAPEARLVVQAFEVDPSGEIVGLNPDYYPMFLQAYNDGARVHSNSWGDVTGPITDTEAAYGGYPFGSQRTDAFLWDHPDSTIFFAAGNSGRDGTPGALGFCIGGNGVVDEDSLLAPGTAKNVITVGASESLRSTGGYSGLPWLLLSFCFATQPIATDLTSNNIEGMAAFSSRGPTDDGRIKPDIVVPGTNIVSNRSNAPGASLLWGAHETNTNYIYSGGTSMATPLAAGTGVLVRQWLMQRGFSPPSGAAVKVVLLNTTHNMAPGQYPVNPLPEVPYERPNSVSGWGRVDLGFLNGPAPYGLWVDDHTSGLATNDLVTYTTSQTRSLEVLSSAQPLRVMLGWTDPPASLAAAAQLVNDLDLEVIGPGGAMYYGNNVTTGDRINNVEGVVIENPPLGAYTVRVRAHNVPVSSQPYALAVGGPIRHAAQLTLTKSANPATEVRPGGLITYTLSLGAQHYPTSAPVVLTDTLPANVTFVSASHGGVLTGAGNSIVQWTVPSLGVGETVARTMTVRVADAASDGTAIVNADYRAANDSDYPVAGSPVTVTVHLPPPGTLSLTKTANLATVVQPGGLITYTLSLGAVSGPVSGVVLSDTLPANTTFVSASNGATRTGPGNSVVVWSIGALAADQTVARTLTVQVAPTATDGMTIVNTTYNATSAGGPPVAGSPVTVTVHLPPPGTLSLTKTANPATVVQPGGLITYTLSLGAVSGPVSGVVLSDTLPANTTFVSASNGATRTGPGNSVVVWSIGALAANQTVARTLTVQVAPTATQGMQIVNTAYNATGSGGASVAGSPVTVTVYVPPGTLSLTKIANPTTLVSPGGLITYTLSLGAVGGPVSGVVLSDTLPANTTFVSASNGATRTGPGNSVVVWSIGALAANQTVARTLTVQVAPTATHGMSIVNTTYNATGSGGASVAGSPVAVTVYLPPGTLSVSKTANPSTVIMAGELLTYTLSLGAVGGPVSGVVLSDTLPVSTTFVQASNGATRSGTGNNVVSWQIGTLSSGQTVSRTLTVQVLPNVPNGTLISNLVYRAKGTDAPLVNGAPVGVLVQTFKAWIPMLNR